MSRYDILLEDFQTLEVKHDTNLNKLQVRFPYKLLSTVHKDKNCLAILLSNGFEFWTRVGWVGAYTELNLKELRRIEQVLNTERVRHG